MSDNETLKILLVGSDELLGDSMKMYFETKGFEVCMASTAEEALAHLHRDSADLIISEHGRSSVDAFALFGEVHKRRMPSRPYKVIICDSCTLGNGCDGHEPHADFCIPKPLNKVAVDRMVNHVFEFYEKKNQ